MIDKFSLSTNFSYDCHWKHLPIDFHLKHHSGEEKILTAYLKSDTNELVNTQELSDTCVKIRRYQIDSKFEIVIVKNRIQLLEREDVETLIEWELLRTFEFFTFFLYKLNIYDERTNQIMLLKAFKVSFAI